MRCCAHLSARFLQKTLIIATLISAYFLASRYETLINKAGKYIFKINHITDIESGEWQNKNTNSRQANDSKYEDTELRKSVASVLKLNVKNGVTGDQNFTQFPQEKTSVSSNNDGAPSTSDPETILVPNYAHLIWYTSEPKEFKFHHLLSVLSAQRVMKAERIYFHHNMEPTGSLWEEAKAKAPNLILQYRDPPKTIFGVKLAEPAFETSYSNADRIKIIQEYGGVYFDLDVVITNPLDALRHYPATVGFELPNWVCGGFIMSKPNSTFIYLWLDTMLDNYEVDKWAYISGFIPTRLVRRFKDMGMVHVEPELIHHPNHSELRYLIGPKSFDWSKNYAVHLWHRLWRQSNHWSKVKVEDAESIKIMNNTYGEIARMIYYGKPELILK